MGWVHTPPSVAVPEKERAGQPDGLIESFVERSRLLQPSTTVSLVVWKGPPEHQHYGFCLQTPSFTWDLSERQMPGPSPGLNQKLQGLGPAIWVQASPPRDSNACA